jgi:hypothetical protein
LLCPLCHQKMSLRIPLDNAVDVRAIYRHEVGML